MDSEIMFLGSSVGVLSAARELTRLGVAVRGLIPSDSLGDGHFSEDVDGYICDSRFTPVSVSRIQDVLPRAGLEFASLPEGVVASGTPGRPVVGGATEGNDVQIGTEFVDAFSEWSWPDEPWGVRTRSGGDVGDVAINAARALYATLTWDTVGVASANSTNTMAHEILLEPAILSKGVSALLDVLAKGLDFRTWVVSDDEMLRFVRDAISHPRRTLIMSEGQYARAFGPGETARRSATSFWFTTNAMPTESKRIHLGWAEAGRVASSLVISNAAPSRSSGRGSLIEATVLTSNATDVDLAHVMADLESIYRTSTSQWALIRSYFNSRNLPLPGQDDVLFDDVAPGVHVLHESADLAEAIRGGIILANRIRKERRRSWRSWFSR